MWCVGVVLLLLVKIWRVAKPIVGFTVRRKILPNFNRNPEITLTLRRHLHLRVGAASYLRSIATTSSSEALTSR